MRRLLTGCWALALLLALCAPARADVLWSPRNDRFFEQHYDQCEVIGRQFYANGDEGFITLWDAPGGTRVVHQFPNGYTLWVYYQYEDWVCAVVWGDEGEISGWAPLKDFALKYDYLCFAEEYGDRLEVVKINIDEEGQLAEEAQVEVIPTLILYRDGKAVDTIVNPGSKAAIDQFIQAALSK